MNDIKKDIQLTDPPTQYIEIDDVSDDYDPREELKEDDKLNDDVDQDDDFTSMPTKTLFKKAQHIL